MLGGGTYLFSPTTFLCDELNPHLLSIGDNVQITANCTILTHDYSWSVIKHCTGEILGNQKSTSIGNNVFIGMGTIILGGTSIGDNVIIGAGSVVSGKVESNAVYCGNPAKKKMTLDEFINKRQAAQISEAMDVFKHYYKCYGKKPPMEIFHEYFMLFENEPEKLSDTFDRKMKLVDSYDKSVKFMNVRTAPFKNYEDFCEYSMKHMNETTK